MLYRIGDISKLLGISLEGLRLYERQGVVHSQRDAKTGYRYYGHLDITALIRSRSYRHMGFGLDETAELLNTDSLDLIVQRYGEREEALRREQLWLAAVTSYLRDLREVTARAEELLGQYELAQSPALYRFEYMYQHKLIVKKEDYPLFRKWVEYAPLSWVGMRCPVNALLGEDQGHYTALNLFAEHARLLGIQEGGSVRRYPSFPCVRTYVSESGGFNLKKCFAPLLRYLEDQGLEPAGDLLGRTFLSYNKQRDYTRLREVWLPVQNKNC